MNVVLKMREDARKRGDWTTADSIRDHLNRIGISLEDTSSGVRWYLSSLRS
jgi:cysteinyl-tRNA synthetase